MKYINLIKYINENKIQKINKKEIFDIYEKIYKNTNIRSFENMITYLKTNNIISEIEKDKYIVITKQIYNYSETKEEKNIYNLINKNYPDINFIVWNTSKINEFTLHYAVNNYIVVEVEKIVIDLIVNLLKENYFKKYTIILQEILNNNRDLFLNYENFIIVKPLHIKSPLKKIENRKYISIEKIMVDLYVDKLYIQYQGKELQTIYQNIFEKYDLNLKKLFKYAKFRTDISKFKKFINNLDIPEKYKLEEE